MEKAKKAPLSKSTYIRGLQCTKSLYLYKNRNFLRDPMPPLQQARLNRGTDVGELARTLFPGGVDVSPSSPSQLYKSVERTAALVRDDVTTVIYEATFATEAVLVMTDILVRGERGWIAYEVKSSLKVSETYREDIALQYYVIRKAGLPLEDIRIIHLDPNYRRKDTLDIRAMLMEESLLGYATERQSLVADRIQEFIQVIGAGTSPRIRIGPHCKHPYPCEFQGHCWKSVPSRSVLGLTELTEEKRFAHFEKGAQLIGEIIPEEDWTPIQRSQWAAETEGKHQIIRDDVSLHLKPVNHSSTFLQLLTSRPAIPLYAGQGAFHPLCIGFGMVKGDEDIPRVVLPEPAEYIPGDAIMQLVEALDRIYPIVVYDMEEADYCFHFWEQEHPHLGEKIRNIRSSLLDIRSLMIRGSLYPCGTQGFNSLASFSAASGFEELIKLKINNPSLAGELYRPLLSGGRHVKGFTLSDIREFLGTSALTLKTWVNWLKHS